jgi:protein phosphatase
MDKIAIISDIHGNLEALKATISDIKKRGINKIYCLGDIIAKGTHSKECIDIIKKECEVVISGNCDYNFSKDFSNEELNQKDEIELKRIRWNKQKLTPEDISYLQSLPFCHEIYISGSLVRLFHATPMANNITVINLDSIETKYNMFLPSEKTISDKVADIVVYGHIHYPYLDKLYNRTLINVGSVGNSFDVIRNDLKDADTLETTKAYYLVIEGELGKTKYEDSISFNFVKVPYDISKELNNNDDNIEKESYEYELKKGEYRNMNKINEGYIKRGIDISKI